ncbi:MAG: MltA domain-containing protein [Vitreimonas sp.]
MKTRLQVALALSATALAACATTPSQTHPAQPSQPQTPAVSFGLQAAQFSDLPDWGSVDLAPALTALKRSCAGRAARAADAPIGSGERYGGSVGDWAPACNAAQSVAPGGERAFFEANFTPYFVQGTGEARLTAYFEPIVQARRQPDAYYSEPLLRRPSDMVTVDVAAFADAYDDSTLRGAPHRLTGQLVGNQVEPYPARQNITPAPGQAFAYANPVDVYNLQVQGSGRLAFPDSTQERANFSAQNGYRWHSALGALRDSGQLQGGATWANFKAWSDAQGPAATRAALNADPSYVFFDEAPVDDPAAGPRGAAGVSLTPLGSLAVDPAYHPYGALLFVDGTYNNAPFRHLLVAQDTGGAIRRGPLRGDVFMGTGDPAGQAAQTMNAPARWWTLLPRGIPIS